MTRPTYPCVLTIAGSDSSGGAGIQADLKTFAANGVYGASIITAVTAQNTCDVRAIHDVPVDIVAAQLDAVFEDIPIAAVKIGMLSSVQIIQTVADRLRAHCVSTIVLDPVIRATSGDPLLHDVAVQTLISELLPLTTVITPNLPEATRLLQGIGLHDTEQIALALLDLGAPAVLLKGGHGDGDILEDLLLTAEGHLHRYRHPLLLTTHTHGTGCSLSSAIAAGLAKGLSLPAATETAITWLQGAIAHAWPLGAGQGPVHHFWQLWPPPDATQEK